MSRFIAVLCVALVGCRAEMAVGHPSAPATAAIPRGAAKTYFAELAGMAAADGGRLWGRSLGGPFVFVDPPTREVVANERDARGALTAEDGVWVGHLGPNDPIANTSIEWSGTRWTMVMWNDDLADDAFARRKLMAHEAFHRVQPELGLVASGEPNDHLDTRDGRYWLQLEWNALESAVLDPALAPSAVSDALAFRAARRTKPEVAPRENALEIQEGLAEDTGARMSGASGADVVGAARARRARTSGFVRSFAYVSGPLYGYLLDRTGEDWRRQVTKETDLAALLAVRGRFEAARSPDAERWSGRALAAAEDALETKRQAQLAAWRKELVEDPVLVIDLTSVTMGTFDPRRMHAFAPSQIVYEGRTLIAVWGKLTVEGAILEDSATKRGAVSLAQRKWTLELSPGWRLAPGERPGDQRIVSP
ncbi:MAG: hypothetical protein U0270_19595 [Labilithrix sp.]